MQEHDTMEEAPELISPRISFSHDLAAAAAAASPPCSSRSDTSATSLVSRSCLPEPEFDFANAGAAAAADVAPADRLFAGGVLLPMPPLPLPPAAAPRQSPCKQHLASGGGGGRAKAEAACQQQQQRRPGSWRASPLFSRSSSVNSATTAAAGAPRSAGRFGCAPFPLMRSRSAGSAAAAAARDGVAGGVAVLDAGGHRARYKKVGAATAANNGGCSRVYYYGGSGRKGGGHGVRVSPVLNVPFIGSSLVNALSYLLCDCSSKATKSRGF
ncbi:hypothetical protein ACP4OV_022365 [Aristida adscensionis]